MKKLLFLVSMLHFSCSTEQSNLKETQEEGFSNEESKKSHFLCKQISPRGFRPYYMKLNSDGETYTDYSQSSKGLLGQNAFTSVEECETAIANANPKFGAICSRTGLNGWKPTTYTGTLPGRADFGYLGGSSIMKFEDCLISTSNSSEKGICYWGGSAWYVGEIARDKYKSGPYNNLDQCIRYTNKIEN